MVTKITCNVVVWWWYGGGMGGVGSRKRVENDVLDDGLVIADRR